MTNTKPTLHIICGKIAAGKSTLAEKLATAERTIKISEDDWLVALFSDEMTSISDYVRCAAKLQSVMGPHIISLLNTGTSAILDFPANTISQRAWMKQVIDAAEAEHKLHYLDTPDEICLERLHARNLSGNHPFSATQEQFQIISKHFVAPTADEGFDIIKYDANGHRA